MFYNTLAKRLEILLDDSYNIVYNNNASEDYEELQANLPSGEKAKAGVLRIVSTQSQFVGDSTIQTSLLRLTLAIPAERDIFDSALENLTNIVATSNNFSVSDGDLTAQVIITGQSDGQKVLWNLNDETRAMMIIDVDLQCLFVNNALDYTDITLTIDGSSLKGIQNIVWESSKTAESVQYSGDTEQDNTITSVGKKLSISGVAFSNDTLLQTLMSEEDTIKNYTVVYGDGLYTRTKSMQVISNVTSALTGGVIQYSLVFVNGSKHNG